MLFQRPTSTRHAFNFQPLIIFCSPQALAFVIIFPSWKNNYCSLCAGQCFRILFALIVSLQQGKIILIKTVSIEIRSEAALDFTSSGSICVKLREPIATLDVFSLCEGIKASAAAFRIHCDGSFSPHLARSPFSFCRQIILNFKRQADRF